MIFGPHRLVLHVDNLQYGFLNRGLLIVFRGFDYDVKLNLVFPLRRMQAIHHEEMLETYILPLAERTGGLSKLSSRITHS